MNEREPVLSRVRPAAACALIALLVGLLAVWVSIVGHDNRLSTLVRMSSGDPIAEYARSDPTWVYAGAHYDGIFFFAMALDPLATGHAHELIDLPANRYGHPLYGWVAGVWAFFDPRVVPVTLALLGLVSMAVAGFAASRSSTALGWTPWGGLLVALNPGVVFAVANDTSEAFGAALLTVGLWLWLTGRRRAAAIVIVAMCFAKEHLLLVPAGLALWEVAQTVRGEQQPRVTLGRIALLVPGPALWLLWNVHVFNVFGEWSWNQADNLVLPIPFQGWLDSLRMAADMAVGDFPATQLGEASIALQITALTAVVLGMARAIRLRHPVDAVYLLVAVLMIYLRWNQTLYPKDLIRGLAFAFVLLPWALITPRLRWASGGTGNTR